MLWRFRKEIILVVCILISLTVFKRGKLINITRYERKKISNKINYEQIIEENRRLRQLLKLKKKNHFFSKTIIAEVISIKPLIFPGEIIVDKGKKDGVEKNMVVVTKDFSLIGRVIESKDGISRIFTIYHPSSRISVVVDSTREIGILTAGPVPFLSLKYIESGSRISEGDGISTSGFSQFFPKGIKVGRVVKIKKFKNELFLKIYVKPFSCLSHLEEVIIGK